MDLFETLGNALRPENSPPPKDELRTKAEAEVAVTVDKDSSHFQTYVLMYMMGFKDAQIAQAEEGVIRSQNLLSAIK